MIRRWVLVGLAAGAFALPVAVASASSGHSCPPHGAATNIYANNVTCSTAYHVIDTSDAGHPPPGWHCGLIETGRQCHKALNKLVRWYQA